MAAMNDPSGGTHRRRDRRALRARARARPTATWWSSSSTTGRVSSTASPSLARARNFNIESLAVGHTERPGISRMTITLRGDDFAVEQMAKQLYRLIDVLKVQDLPETQRRGARARAHQGPRHRTTSAREILRIIELYKGRVLDVGA